MPRAENRGENFAQRIRRLNPTGLPVISSRPPQSIPLDGMLWWGASPEAQVMQTAQRIPLGNRGAAAASEEPTHTPGVCQYAVLERLGQGAFSTVYRAQRRQEGLHVALKLMKRSTDDFEDVAKQEFEMLRSIENPHIIKAFDFMTSAHHAYIGVALELFDGNDLESAGSISGPLPADSALKLFMQLVEAIAYLHSKGIIHRDIKAEHIMVDHDFCRLKLVDFNVATRLEKGALTPTGTPSYFSPEVREGEPTDKAQDVWAMGLCLHFMLCGRLTFNSNAIARPENNCWPADQPLSTERICGVALSRRLQFHQSRRTTAPTLLAELRSQLVLLEHELSELSGPML